MVELGSGDAFPFFGVLDSETACGREVNSVVISHGVGEKKDTIIKIYHSHGNMVSMISIAWCVSACS